VNNDRFTAARFLTQTGHFSRTNNKVKRPAFMPAAKDNKASIFDIENQTSAEVEECGRSHVLGPAVPKLYGFGKFHTDSVLSAGLMIEKAEPPPRHANIVNWPPPDEKEKQILIALQIADTADLCLFDSIIHYST